MAALNLSRRAQHFIFDVVDSVELLETLFLLASNPTRAWDAEAVAREMRSIPNSILTRFEILKENGLIKPHLDSSTEYVYCTDDAELTAVVAELAEAYKMHRSRLVAMIFSPLKRARDIADAFRLSDRRKK